MDPSRKYTALSANRKKQKIPDYLYCEWFIREGRDKAIVKKCKYRVRTGLSQSMELIVSIGFIRIIAAVRRAAGYR